MSSLDRSRRGRGRSPAPTGWRHPSELMARRGMLLIVIAALVLTAALVLANSLATLG